LGHFTQNGYGVPPELDVKPTANCRIFSVDWIILWNRLRDWYLSMLVISVHV